MAEQKDYSREFKLTALQRMAAGENVAALARELGVKRKRLYLWRDAYRQEGEASLRMHGRPPVGQSPPPRACPDRPMLSEQLAEAAELAVAKRRIADLERKIGQQELDLDFFQKALRHFGGKAPVRGGNGGTGSTTRKSGDTKIG